MTAARYPPNIACLTRGDEPPPRLNIVPKPSQAASLTAPIEPMLAKLAEAVPEGDYVYEPKWDGFRALIFRGSNDVYLQSRDSRPLDRYFPDLHAALLERLPPDCVLDGEIVIATARGLDFEALQLRLHPAASRVAKLAQETPASFVAFDVLAVGARSLMACPQSERRTALQTLLAGVAPPEIRCRATKGAKRRSTNSPDSSPAIRRTGCGCRRSAAVWWRSIAPAVTPVSG